MVENYGYTHQQFGIDARALEYFVSIRTVASELSRKPHGGTFLPMKLLLYQLAYKYLIHNIKRAELTLRSAA